MRYHQPTTLEGALTILADDPGSRCLAGGQTLVAMLNAQLLEPSALVSLKAIPELRGIADTGRGITIGAMTTHATVATDSRLRGQLAIVRIGAGHIANQAVRARGTMGGSISHADPAADYPTVLTAANADIEIAGKDGRRRIPVRDFFVGYFTTALEQGEMVVAIHLGKPDEEATSAYRKVRRAESDFATASVAFSGKFVGGRCAWASVAVGGCGTAPVWSEKANSLLAGARPGDPTVVAAATALVENCDPIDDVRGSAEYRRMLVRRILPNLFAEAADQSAVSH